MKVSEGIMQINQTCQDRATLMKLWKFETECVYKDKLKDGDK